MRRHTRYGWILLVVLVLPGIYGIYHISPYGRHDRQAADYEHDLRARVRRVGDVRIISGEHRVSGNRWGNGGECSLLAALEVSAPMSRPVFSGNLESALDAHPDVYLSRKITRIGGRGERRLFRVETGTLAEGGTLDLRCG